MIPALPRRREQESERPYERRRACNRSGAKGRRKVDEPRWTAAYSPTQCLRAVPVADSVRRRRNRKRWSGSGFMVMTRWSRRLGRRSLAVFSEASGWPFIAPLVGKTTDWRAGCGRSASPVRREGGPPSIGSPYPYLRQKVRQRKTPPKHQNRRNKARML
jgi:hypothetical protein